ncbi:MAG: putative nucleotidyltransferase substrate binding domain-containing protein [Bacillota bacterium]
MEAAIGVLRSITPFSSLSEAVLEEIAPETRLRAFPKGTYVFRQGTPSLQALFIVVEGLAEVTVTNNQGRESVVGFRHPHDFFGETVVLTDEDYPGSVRARKDLTCLEIPREVFERLMYHHPEVSRFFSRVLLSRMRSLYREIVADQAPDFVRAEAALFRRRAAEIMSAPVVTCRTSEPVHHVAQVMVEKNIGSVVVVDQTGHPVGLVTERDLVARLTDPARGWPARLTAEAVMRRKLIQVPTTAYLYEVLVEAIKYGCKHLTVTENGFLVGIISVADLARARGTGTLWFAHRIETQPTLAGLRETSRDVDGFLHALIREKTPVRDILAIISELHDAFTRRVIQLCEAEVEQTHGPRPSDYCWIAMGSAGRREQTIRTDQDDAVIYADPGEGAGAAAAKYFLHLGTTISKALADCGFRECSFGVTPSNPEWCRSLGAWREHLVQLLTRAEPEDIRRLTILLDFRPVYGDVDLARSLWQTAFMSFEQLPGAVLDLAADCRMQMRVPLNLFGGFITEKSGPHKNEINLKAAACLHIVNCTRVLALKHRISATPTLERLALLVEQGAIPPDEAEFIEAAYETLLMFRIRENLKKLEHGEEPDNYVNPEALSKREQEVLRGALSVITRIQNLIAGRFGESLRLYPT